MAPTRSDIAAASPDKALHKPLRGLQVNAKTFGGPPVPTMVTLSRHVGPTAE